MQVLIIGKKHSRLPVNPAYGPCDMVDTYTVYVLFRFPLPDSEYEYKGFQTYEFDVPEHIYNKMEVLQWWDIAVTEKFKTVNRRCLNFEELHRIP